jgi:hypothetical protein
MDADTSAEDEPSAPEGEPHPASSNRAAGNKNAEREGIGKTT